MGQLLQEYCSQWIIATWVRIKKSIKLKSIENDRKVLNEL